MITVCSRCKRTISQTPVDGSEKKVSHGICTQCLVVLESEIRESSKAQDLRSGREEIPLRITDP